MLNDLKWFGESAPQKFIGFNVPMSPYPFWSSDAITLGLSILGYSKYDKLTNK